MTFVGVGIMASIAIAGLFFGIPRNLDAACRYRASANASPSYVKIPLLTGFLSYDAMGDRSLYGLHLFRILFDHGYRTRRRVSGRFAIAPVSVAIVIWGLAAWAFFPAQQSRLMQAAGLKIAAIALSLNASFMYLGFSLGATLGSLVLMHAPVTLLGFVGAVCEIAALSTMLATARSRAPQ